jgi:type IV pilus assembly protein PilY1
VNQNLVYRINASENDAEESSDTSMSLTGNVLNMDSSQTNGLRFTNVMINQGASILSAQLVLTAQSSDTGSATLTLKGQAADDSNAFVSSDGNISDRGVTSASVSWSPGSWSTNNEYTSPDLKDVIQEIVDRANWQPGNALTLIQTGSGGERRAYTFNNQPADAAYIKIKVRSGGVAVGSGKTVRTRLKEIVNEFVPSGYTPIVDTLYEAANYYRGGDVLYGASRGAQTTYGRVSHPDSYTGGNLYRANGCTDENLNASECSSEEIRANPVYTSPMVDACQTNHIVVLTDGQANHNHSVDEIKSLTGSSSCDTSSGNGGETCGRELADWLAAQDQSDTLSADQNIKTYTIGFNLDEGGQASAIQFLRDLANNGGGNYYPASTSSELATAFQNIIRSIMNTDTTFVSPGATVNQFNRLTHQNDIYFSVFKPATRPSWPGNLKRYELKGDPAIIVDAQDQPAVNPNTGFFDADAKSFWSDQVDGNKVAEGGAASELSLVGRNVYTYTGTSSDLTHITNTLHESNTDLTKTLLGIESQSDTYRSNLLKWARGVDVKDADEDGSDTDIRLEMGAPLHSQAVVLTYGGTEGNQDNVVFFATNEGYLHAIDTDDGSEVFSFVPRELLANLDRFFDNAVGANLPYGLDGPITYWVKDVDGDHIIEADDGDHVYIYVGMRRGGQNYYALDVTARNTPRLLWTIAGGSGDYAELGQTWSSAVHTQVKVGSTVKDVLIFSGGYDPDQDDQTTRTADSQGRAIYIVDAATGALVWSGGPTTNPNGSYTQTFADLNYSIPSDIRIIDINTDGLADRMYVGDMGGQLWRFDINNGAAAASLVTGGVIADLALNASGTNDAANNRRFYYAPDVSMTRRGTQRYLTIAMGSGWRAHPLDLSIQDRFYVLRDYDVYNAPASYTKLTESNLYNATENNIGETSGAEQETELSSLWDSNQGWYIDLEGSGEKVLAESLTVNNQILFTTYQPTASAGTCSAGRGLGTLYIVSAYDATPVMNLDQVGDDSSLTKSDRKVELARNGIPPKPTVLFPSDTGGTAVPDPILCIGAECGQNLDFGNILERTFWREESTN